MAVIYIDRDKLLALLKRAYEEGCHGYLDLRDSTAEGILEDHLKSQPLVGPPGKFEPYEYLSTDRLHVEGPNRYLVGFDVGISPSPVILTTTDNTH